MMAESVNDVATVQRNLQRDMAGAEDDLVAQGRQARELQRDLLRTRMVEFDSLAERLYAVVRQTSKRSEEHTSELQSPCNLVCRLLLEKKKECLYSEQPFCWFSQRGAQYGPCGGHAGDRSALRADGWGAAALAATRGVPPVPSARGCRG